jgi:hypothetical protein
MKCPVCWGFRSRGSFFRTSGLGKLQIGNIEVQNGTSRDDYGTLNHVLKLSYAKPFSE